MQTALSQKMSLAGTAVRASVPTSAPRRVTVVVRAQAEAESRRAVLGGLFAGVAALTASKAGAIELIDDRKALDKGFNLIYEARDLDLPQATRDGFTQARQSLDATKKRVAESEKRIDSVLKGYIDKQYWTLAREELRLQVGTLRFDLNALTDAKGGKAEKKKADELKKAFLQAVSDLDFSLRKKDPAAAQQRLVAATTSLDNVLAVL